MALTRAVQPIQIMCNFEKKDRLRTLSSDPSTLTSLIELRAVSEYVI